jgi:hypothetical protein
MIVGEKMRKTCLKSPHTKSVLAAIALTCIFTFASPCQQPPQDPASQSAGAQDNTGNNAQAGPSASQETVRGVNPADNISKFEILPRLSVIDNDKGISIMTTTLKFDKAIQGTYGLNVEFPVFARFESPFGSNNGVGDLNIRFRVQRKLGKRMTGIAGVETVWPTASAATLGFGKYQINPTIALVYAFSSKVFIAPVIKQYFSVAGDSARPGISLGQYRFLAAYSSPNGYWLLADPQLFVDYYDHNRVDFAPEAEVGKMIAPTTGVWFRAGGHVSGSLLRQSWFISTGIRFIMIPGLGRAKP